MADPVVLVLNTSPDTIEMLRGVLQKAGMVVLSAYTYDVRDGRVDLDAMMREHHPSVVVYDIAPPYDENWRLFRHLRAVDAMRGSRFVLTTTNLTHVQPLVGRDERIYEVVGRPLDLDEITKAVKEALRARPTR